MFLYFVASNCFCRFSIIRFDWRSHGYQHYIGHIFFRRGRLNRVYPQTCHTLFAITLTFWAVYLQLLKLLFHYVKIISSFKLLFKFISPVHINSRRVQFGSVIWKVKYLKLKTPCTSPRLSSEFCWTIQVSNCLVVCHYHDFSPKQLRSSEL